MTNPAIEPKASTLVNTLQLKQFRELSVQAQLENLEQCDRLLKDKHCDRLTTKRQLISCLEILAGSEINDNAQAKAQKILTDWNTPSL